MNTGDAAIQIGDSGDQRGPCLSRTIGIDAIVAIRVETQGRQVRQAGQVTMPQPGFRPCARNRAGHGPEPTCGVCGARCLPRSIVAERMGTAAIRGRSWLGLRQTEKAPGLVGDITKIQQPEAFTDDVEQIAMLSRRAIRPFPRATTPVRSTMQADIERPPRGVMNIPDQPVIAVPSPGREVMATDRLGVLGQPAGQIASTP